MKNRKKHLTEKRFTDTAVWPNAAATDLVDAVAEGTVDKWGVSNE